VVEQLGNDLRFDNVLNVPPFPKFKVAEEKLREWMVRNWDTYLPVMNKRELTIGNWELVSDKEYDDYWEPYINPETGGWGDWDDDYRPKFHPWPQYDLWSITFSCEHSPPYRAVNQVYEEFELMEARLAYESPQLGIVGRWESHAANETGKVFDFVLYTDDGYLCKKGDLKREEWEMVEEIWTEIHGPKVITDRIGTGGGTGGCGFNWKWKQWKWPKRK